MKKNITENKKNKINKCKINFQNLKERIGEWRKVCVRKQLGAGEKKKEHNNKLNENDNI